MNDISLHFLEIWEIQDHENYTITVEEGHWRLESLLDTSFQIDITINEDGIMTRWATSGDPLELTYKLKDNFLGSIAGFSTPLLIGISFISLISLISFSLGMRSTFKKSKKE